MKKADSEDGDPDARKPGIKVEDDGAVFGSMAAAGRESKRRKVGAAGAGLDDPFGGPL